MEDIPNCPECGSEDSYNDGLQLACPACGYEWNPAELTADDGSLKIHDAHGNLLQDGDTITVIKDLKIKGSSQVVKVGTRIKNIRLVQGDHDIDCKISGIGPMQLKSQFVKKA